MIDLWYKNAIVYCLDVGTFADTSGSGVGDFRGLCDRLPYLAGIGITCVWLTIASPSLQVSKRSTWMVTTTAGCARVSGNCGNCSTLIEVEKKARPLLFDNACRC